MYRRLMREGISPFKRAKPRNNLGVGLRSLQVPYEVRGSSSAFPKIRTKVRSKLAIVRKLKTRLVQD